METSPPFQIQLRLSKEKRKREIQNKVIVTGWQARSLNFYFRRIPEITPNHGSQKWEIFASVPFWSLWCTSQLSGFMLFPSRSWSLQVCYSRPVKSSGYNTPSQPHWNQKKTFLSLGISDFLNSNFYLPSQSETTFLEENQIDKQNLLIYPKSCFSLMLAQEDWSSSRTIMPICVTEILWATPSSHLERQSPFKDDYFISGVKDIFLALSCKKLQWFVKKLFNIKNKKSFFCLLVCISLQSCITMNQCLITKIF